MCNLQIVPFLPDPPIAFKISFGGKKKTKEKNKEREMLSFQWLERVSLGLSFFRYFQGTKNNGMFSYH